MPGEAAIVTALRRAAIAQPVGSAGKREQVLDAAEACFVRSGFHRATMQDIAREAAMSPANIYRYFDSKEAVVLGLADRARARGAVILSALEQAGDRFAAFSGLLRQFFTELTREHAVLRVEIWAEASRNPPIADMVARGEAETRAWFVEMLSGLARVPDLDADRLYERLHPTMKGMVVGRALTPDYDPTAALVQLQATIEQGIAGGGTVPDPSREQNGPTP
jgi:TetR/AcrR family transcriptional repressor of uid operon